MKLSTKLSITMLTLTASLLVVGGVSMYYMRSLGDISLNIASQKMPATVYVQEINTAVANFRRAELQHIISENEQLKRDFSTSLSGFMVQIDSLSSQYSELLTGESEQQAYTAYVQQWEQYKRLHTELMRLSNAFQKDEAMQFLSANTREVFKALGQRLDTITKQNIASSIAAAQNGYEHYGTIRNMIIALLVISVLVSVLVAMYIIRSTERLLGKDPGELSTIAKNVTRGDYSLPRNK